LNDEKKKPARVGELLQAYLKKAGLIRRVGQAKVLEDWPELVGPQIAKVTQPESVGADGVLRVRVATAAWAQELQLMTPQILGKLNKDRAGRITSIRWMAG
jgi:predicted nucleic acid-binding Zn ribbon protein